MGREYAEEHALPSYKWIGERRGVRNQHGNAITHFPGGVGFSVRGCLPDKSVRVLFSIAREDGTREMYLLDAYYVDQWGGGWEKWQTHRLPLFPYDGPHGRAVSMSFSYSIRRDGGVVPSRYEYFFGSLDDFDRGRVEPSDFDLRKEENTTGERVEARAAEVEAALGRINDSFSPDAVRPFFTRGDTGRSDHPLREIHLQLDRVIETKLRDRARPATIKIAVYDFENHHIANHLIYAASLGIEVVCVADWAQVSPMTWAEGVTRLRRAGIPVYGVVRNTPGDPSGGIASMHTKLILFNGEVAHSSSYNLHFHVWGGNWENGMFYYSRDHAALYDSVFRAIRYGISETITVDPLARYNLYYSFGRYASPQGSVRAQDVIVTEIDRARESIDVCMFCLSYLRGRSLYDHRRIDAVDALIQARNRGVRVRVILNGMMAHSGPEPPAWDKEFPRPLTGAVARLRDAWIEVYYVYYWESIFSPLHHKFAVFDGRTVISESYNWYEASPFSDEVVSVVRDETVAAAFLQEIDLICRTFRIARG